MASRATHARKTHPHPWQRITAAHERAKCAAPDATTLNGIRDRARLHTLASSGMRASATATLTSPQITETDQGMGVWVPDTNDWEPQQCLRSRAAWHGMEAGRAARAAFAPQLTGALRERGEQSMSRATVFLAFDGQGDRRLSPCAMTPTAIGQAVQASATQSGRAHLKPHDVRRARGTRLAAQDIRVAHKALGHKDIRTTALHDVLDDLTLGQRDDLY